MDFPSLANSDHVVVSVSIDVPLNLQRDALFRRITYEYYRANWVFFVIIWDHKDLCDL